MYPQRCDLSPDGRYFAYFALKPGSRWPAGETYLAVSKLPWLYALAAWRELGTYTRGMYFTDKATSSFPPPDVGSIEELPFGLDDIPADGFAVERRRGWRESPLNPPRADNDFWGERRGDAVVMTKPNQLTRERLQVHGLYGAFRNLWVDPSSRPRYETVDMDGATAHLDDVQWADWSRDGRLLVATIDGQLQIRDRSSTVWRVTWAYDTTLETPTPKPAPPDAKRW